MYVLQSISSIFPEFLSSEAEKRLEAKKKWWEDNDAMQEALYSAAKKALGETEAEKYVISGLSKCLTYKSYIKIVDNIYIVQELVNCGYLTLFTYISLGFFFFSY